MDGALCGEPDEAAVALALRGGGDHVHRVLELADEGVEFVEGAGHQGDQAARSDAGGGP